MKKAAPLVLLALLVVAGIYLLDGFGGTVSAPGSEARVPEQESEEPASTPGAKARPTEESVARKAVGQERTDDATLRLLVVRAGSGAPVAGRRVQLDSAGRRMGGSSLRTGPDGRLEWSRPATFSLRGIRVECGADHPSHRHSGPIVVRAGEPPTEVVVEIGAGAALTGRVVDGTGAAVPDARVLAWFDRSAVYRVEGEFRVAPDREVSSDAGGRFRIDHAGDRFKLEAIAGEQWGLHRPGGKVAGRETIEGLEIVVAPTVEMTGALLDHERRPIAGHPVGAHHGGGTRPTAIDGVEVLEPIEVGTTTAADGSFRVRAIADYNEIWEVQHPRHPMFRVRHKPGDGPLEIVLAGGVSLRGVAYLADGRPAAGAVVTLNDYPRRIAECAADGRWLIEGAQPLEKKSFLRVDHPEAAIHCEQPLDAGAVEYRVRLARPFALAGSVRDAEGHPVVGASVDLVGDRRVDPGYGFGGEPTWEWAFGMQRAKTDAEGLFRVERLYDGEFSLKVHPPGDDRLNAVVTARSGSENVVIILDPRQMRRVVFRGRVTDAATGEPLESFVLTPMLFDGGIGRGEHVRRTGRAGGRFELVGFDPGDYELRVVADGYAAWSGGRRAYAVGDHDFEARLERSRNLVLRVRDSAGKLVSGRVRMRTPRGAEISMRQGRSSSMAYSLRNGELRVQGVPAAVVVIAIEPPGGESQERTVDLAALQTDELDLVIAAEPEPRRVALAFMGVGKAEPEPDFTALDQARERMMKLMVAGTIWPIDVAITVDCLDADGKVVGQGKITPVEGSEKASPIPGMKAREWVTTYRRGRSSSSRKTTTPVPMFGHRVSGAAIRVRIRAAGYQERTVPIPAADDPAKRLPIVWLRRDA